MATAGNGDLKNDELLVILLELTLNNTPKTVEEIKSQLDLEQTNRSVRKRLNRLSSETASIKTVDASSNENHYRLRPLGLLAAVFYKQWIPAMLSDTCSAESHWFPVRLATVGISILRKMRRGLSLSGTGIVMIKRSIQFRGFLLALVTIAWLLRGDAVNIMPLTKLSLHILLMLGLYIIAVVILMKPTKWIIRRLKENTIYHGSNDYWGRLRAFSRSYLPTSLA